MAYKTYHIICPFSENKKQKTNTNKQKPKKTRASFWRICLVKINEISQNVLLWQITDVSGIITLYS